MLMSREAKHENMKRRKLLLAVAGGIGAAAGCLDLGSGQSSRDVETNRASDVGADLAARGRLQQFVQIPDLDAEYQLADINAVVSFGADPSAPQGSGTLVVEHEGEEIYLDDDEREFGPGESSLFRAIHTGPIGGDELHVQFEASEPGPYRLSASVGTEPL